MKTKLLLLTAAALLGTIPNSAVEEPSKFYEHSIHYHDVWDSYEFVIVTRDAEPYTEDTIMEANKSLISGHWWLGTILQINDMHYFKTFTYINDNNGTMLHECTFAGEDEYCSYTYDIDVVSLY